MQNYVTGTCLAYENKNLGMATCNKGATANNQNFAMEDDLYLTLVPDSSKQTKIYVTTDAESWIRGGTDVKMTDKLDDNSIPAAFEMRQGTAEDRLRIPATTESCPDDDICGL